LQGHRIKLKRKKEKKRKTKRQNRRQSVVAGRQQLYCAVQSRSPRCTKHTKQALLIWMIEKLTEKEWPMLGDTLIAANNLANCVVIS